MTNLEILNAYIGDTQVEKIYLGADVVWDAAPVPPTCADSGLCGDYPDCYECTCEDQFPDNYQAICECEGRYWYNDTCNDEPQPTCEEQGLCGDDPNTCYECDCEEQYEEGTQELCECQGKYWYNDTCNDEPEYKPTCDEQGLCGADPDNCYECGGEEDCNNTDPYNWWDVEEEVCHSCWDEWEDLGYSSPEECACDKRGNMCDEGE